MKVEEISGVSSKQIHKKQNAHLETISTHYAFHLGLTPASGHAIYPQKCFISAFCTQRQTNWSNLQQLEIPGNSQ